VHEQLDWLGVQTALSCQRQWNLPEESQSIPSITMGYVLLTACGRHLWYSSYELSEEGSLGWSAIGPRLDLGEQVRRAVRELSIVKATIADHQVVKDLVVWPAHI
jgi:hypothetical protein